MKNVFGIYLQSDIDPFFEAIVRKHPELFTPRCLDSV